MTAMSSITDRYDRNARLYEQWWAPVLAPSAAKLLDRCDSWVRDATARQGQTRILDIGTGTGALAIDAAHRWPGARILATDASEGMLEVARRREAERAGAGPPAAPISWSAASADALGLPAASIDLAVSSFVFQLVADRTAAYEEVLRVLRPGGRLHLVTWLAGRDEFRPADEFDEAVYDVAIDEGEEQEERRAGDYRSPTSAIRELRRAGFRSVSAEIDRLDQLWTAGSYLDYKLHYDELGLMSELDAITARRLRSRASDRLAALEPEAFRWRPPIVYLQGKRPGG
jgi:ubiquinone/menaquinone biosynthesis C-methylase UbiE